MIDDVQYKSGTDVRFPFLECQDQHGTKIALGPTDATPSSRRRLVKWGTPVSMWAGCKFWGED